MEVTKFEIRKDGDSHIASFTVRLNTDTDKFNDKMEEILDRTRKKLEDMHKINPGDYFIARRPKDATGGLPWIDAMNKFDGVIQKCASSGEDGRILSENTFMDTWWYDPSWCKKVSPGDVMKTRSGGVFIFKEVKGGRVFDYAYLNSFGYVIITDDEISSMTYSHATPEEARPLFDALAKGGKRWNAEKMCIEDMPKFKTDEECLRAWGCSEKEINETIKCGGGYEKAQKELWNRAMEYINNYSQKYESLFTPLKITAVNEVPVSNCDTRSAIDSLMDFHTRGADESLERQIKTLFGSFADNSPTTYSLSSEEVEAIKKVIKTCKELLNGKKITL